MKGNVEKNEKIVIYQTVPRLFGNVNASLVKNGSKEENGTGKFGNYTAAVLEKIKGLGATHIWYTGVIEHATLTDYSAYGIRRDHSVIVKGKAGSFYAIKDYYDVDPDLAKDVPSRMKEFERLVERTHQAGLKVIIDFVPNHVARQYYSDVKPPYVEDLGQRDNTNLAFDPNNNFYYIPGQPLNMYFGAQSEDYLYAEFPAKATGNNQFGPAPSHNDWYETIKLNYGVDYQNGGATHFDPYPNTWGKMLDILNFWASKHIDGFRCDMAGMVPVEFWEWVIPEVKKAHAHLLFIAEIYTPEDYRNYLIRGQFDYLYDKVGLYDTLRAVIRHEAPASDITRTWQSIEGIQHAMLNFLENHDEQRIASDFFAGNPEAGFPGMIVAATMNTNPVMVYNGQELGERGMDDEGFSGRDGRTSIFDYWSMESVRNWVNNWTFKEGKLTEKQVALRKAYAGLLNLVKNEPALSNGRFYDLEYANFNNPHFDPQRQYVFMRKYRNELILVIVNFDNTERQVSVHIPPEAFKALDVVDNKAAEQVDLLTGERAVSTLTSAYPYQATTPAYGGKILKFIYGK